MTYQRAGREWPEDLLILCWDDHKLVHRREQQGMSLLDATMSVLADGAED